MNIVEDLPVQESTRLKNTNEITAAVGENTNLNISKDWMDISVTEPESTIFTCFADSLVRIYFVILYFNNTFIFLGPKTSLKRAEHSCTGDILLGFGGANLERFQEWWHCCTKVTRHYFYYHHECAGCDRGC